MAILSIQTTTTGLSGVVPSVIYIDTSSTQTQILEPGFLNGAQDQGYTFSNKQMALVTTTDNGIDWYTVSISNGVVSLELGVGGVVLPVVNGNFANFLGTDGAIDDAGFSPSDATKIKVSMVSAATVANNLAKFSDTAGTVANAGFKIIAGVTNSYGGGGTANNFTATGMTATSFVTATISTATSSTVSINKITPGAGFIAVQFTSDPGAGTTLDYIATTAAVT